MWVTTILKPDSCRSVRFYFAFPRCAIGALSLTVLM